MGQKGSVFSGVLQTNPGLPSSNRASSQLALADWNESECSAFSLRFGVVEGALHWESEGMGSSSSFASFWLCLWTTTPGPRAWASPSVQWEEEGKGMLAWMISRDISGVYKGCSSVPLFRTWTPAALRGGPSPWDPGRPTHPAPASLPPDSQINGCPIFFLVKRTLSTVPAAAGSPGRI